MAAAGVFLVAGHAGDAVIQHAGNHLSLVVNDLGSAGHTAVEEGGVAHDTKHLLVGYAFALKRLGHAHTGGEATAHTHAHIHATQRRSGTQRITADIAGDHKVLVLGQGIEETTVGTTRAKRRRTGHRLCVHLHRPGLRAENAFAQQLGIELIKSAGQFLAHALNAGGADLLLHDGLQLLNDIELPHPGGKITDEIHGQRIGKTQLQERGVLRKHLFGVLIGHGGGNDAHLAAGHLHAVDGAAVGVLFHAAQPLLHHRMVAIGIGRGTHIFTHIARIRARGHLFPLTQFHQRLGVVHAGGGAEQNRGVKHFGNLTGHTDKVLALLAVCRLHHGNAGSAGIVAVILLILRRVHAGVVGCDDHIGSTGSHVGGGKQGIGRHVQSHVLHSAQGAHTGYCGTIGHLRGHLFIGCPLAVDILFILRRIFQDFGTGGAGIGRAKLNASLIDAPRNGLITRQKFLFHHKSSSLTGFRRMVRRTIHS